MIKFKNKRDVKLFSALHPVLIMIFADLYTYAYEKHGIKLTVTDTVSTKMRDKILKRKSAAHRQCRAIDIRTKDVDAFILSDLLEYINNKTDYKKYHYLSRSGEKRLAYYHGVAGKNEHIHLAIHSMYSLEL